MARINIDDSIYQDRRFFNLTMKVGDLDKAIGCLVRAWSVAQRWYTKPEKTIPYEEWKKQCLLDEIIEVGLAKMVENSCVRMCGSDEQFAWLTQRIEAGRKGGLAGKKMNGYLEPEEAARRQAARLVLARTIKSGKMVKPDFCEDCGSQFNVEGHHSDYSKPLDVEWLCKSCHLTIHKQLEASATAKRPLTSAKRSLSKREPPTLSLKKDIINLDFEIAYREYPRKMGKRRGLAICQRQIRNEADFFDLMRAIASYKGYLHREKTETKFIKHFSTFMNNWKDWLEEDASEDFSDSAKRNQQILETLE